MERSKVKEKEKSSTFKEWADVTTAHGFLDFSHATSIIGKIIWILLIAVSLIIMTYQLCGLIGNYTDHEWASNIQDTPPLPGSNGVQFPYVIICNVNRLKFSKVKQYNMTLAMVRFFFLNSFQDQYLIRDGNSSVYTEFINWQRSMNLSYLGIFEKMAPSCEDIFLVNATECRNGKITTIQTLEYGQCYRIEMNSNDTTFTSGSKGGHQVLLDTQGWDYVPVIENNYLIQGLAVQLSYTGLPQLGNWIMLQSGAQTTLNMQLYETSVKLPPKTSVLNPFQLLDSLNSKPPCALNPSLKYFNYTPYSAVDCAVECFWNQPVAKCNCIPYIPNRFYPMCEINKIYPCVFDLTDTYTFSDYFSEIMQCASGCDKPCYDRYVETTIGQTAFPSAAHQPALESYLKVNNFNQVRVEDLIFLQYYFGSLNTKVIESYEAISLNDLVSNAGGLIGVWAGMSFLTVFQAVQYLFKFFNQCFAEKRKRSKSIGVGN